MEGGKVCKEAKRNVYYLGCGDDFEGVYICRKLSNVHLEYAQFIFFNKVVKNSKIT